MKRQLTMAVIACLALGALIGLAPTAAQAQAAPSTCFPPPANGDYPPEGPSIEPALKLSLSDGFLLPSHTDGHLEVTGAIAGLTYCGTLFSVPVTMPLTVASSAGVIDFRGFTVPADFQLNVTHQLDVYRQQHLVGQFQFCVNTSGHLVEAGSATCKGASSTGGGSNATKPPGSGSGSGGSLPHTGWDHMMEVLKAAALALALGAFFMYLRRRRAASVLRT